MYLLSELDGCETSRKTVGAVMRRAYPYVLFLVLVCLFLWRPIFRGEALLPGDYLAQMLPWSAEVRAESPSLQWNPLQWDAIAQFYPWRVFYARSMQQGKIPLWNPHQFSGTPFLANGQSAVLYPPNLIFLIFDPITSFTILAALHLFLAASFMYLLLRALDCRELGGIVGGITYTFSAFMVLWLELPTFICAATWLPLVLLLVHRSVEKRSVLYGTLSGLALSMAVLAGHLQIAFYVVLAAFLWWIWRLAQVWRAEGRKHAFAGVIVPMAACFVVFALIASAQLLPSIELSRNSHRAVSATTEGYDWFIGNAVKPYRLITAFAPRFFGDPSRNDYYFLGRTNDGLHVGSAADYMEYGLYAGILPFILALLGLSMVRRKPRIGFFAVISLFALLTATGTPINHLFYNAIPGFSSLGGPNRILILYFLGLAVMSGFGADYMAENLQGEAAEIRTQRRRKLAVVVSVLAIVVLSYVVSYQLGMDAASHFMNWAVEDISTLVASIPFVILLFLSGAILIGRLYDTIGRTTFSVVVVILVIIDLFAFGINYNPTSNRKLIYPQTELTTKLKKIAGNSRIAPINPEWSLFETPKAILPPNAAMVYGLYDVQGYDSLYMRQYKDFMYSVQGVDPSPPENGNMVLVRSAEQLNTDFYDLVTYTITQELLRDDIRLPVSRSLLVDTTYIYKIGNSGLCNVGEGGYLSAIKTRMLGPNRIEANTPDAKSFFYVVCPFGTNSPGWFIKGIGNSAKSRYDGQIRLTAPGERPVSIAGAGSIVMAGPAKLEFFYEPFSFRFGFFLMLIGVGAISCIGVYHRLRYNKS